MASKKRPKTGRRKGHATRTSFKKGDPRINRKGRPPLSLEEREFRELARTKSVSALERIDELAQGKGMTAVRANEIIIERGYGKPKQEFDATVKGGGLLIGLPAENPDG